MRIGFVLLLVACAGDAFDPSQHTPCKDFGAVVSQVESTSCAAPIDSCSQVPEILCGADGARAACPTEPSSCSADKCYWKPECVELQGNDVVGVQKVTINGEVGVIVKNDSDPYYCDLVACLEP